MHLGGSRIRKADFNPAIYQRFQHALSAIHTALLLTVIDILICSLDFKVGPDYPFHSSIPLEQLSALAHPLNAVDRAAESGC